MSPLEDSFRWIVLSRCFAFQQSRELPVADAKGMAKPLMAQEFLQPRRIGVRAVHVFVRGIKVAVGHRLPRLV